MSSFFPLGPGYESPVKEHWGVAGAVGATDLFAPRGTAIYAVFDGTVTSVRNDPIGGRNLMLVNDSGLMAYYAHCETITVRQGDDLRSGQLLGTVGDSGNAAGKGTHLHIGIGYGIASGSGPTGGAGIGFDAVAFLERLRTQTYAPTGDAETEDDSMRHSDLVVAIAYLTDNVIGETVANIANALRDDGSAETAEWAYHELRNVIAEAKRVRVQFLGGE